MGPDGGGMAPIGKGPICIWDVWAMRRLRQRKAAANERNTMPTMTTAMIHPPVCHQEL